MNEKIKTIDRLPYFQGEFIDRQKLKKTKIGIRPSKDARIPKPIIVYRQSFDDNKGGH